MMNAKLGAWHRWMLVLLAACILAPGLYAAPVKKVKIIIDAWALGEVPFREMAKKYNALHPELEIVIEPTPGAWGTKVAAQQKAGNLTWSAAGIIQPFLWLYASVRTESIVPLEPLFAASKEPGAKAFLNELLPSLKQDGSMDGKLYLIPYSVENISMQYRKDYLEAAGIKKAPRSWEELYQACVAVKKSMEAAGRKDVYPLVFDLDLFRGLGALYFSATSKPYGSDGLMDWKSAEMKQSLQWMRKMVAEGLMPPMAGEGAEIVDMWRRGRICFYYAPCSRANWAQRIVGFEKVDNVPIPTIDGKSKSGTTFWGNSFQIFRGAPHPQEAFDFLVFAMGPQNEDFQDAVIKSGKPTGFSSTFDLVATDPKYANYRWMTAMREQFDMSFPAPKTYYMAMQSDAWNKYRIEYFRTGSKLTEEELADKIIAHVRELEKKTADILKTEGKK